jgi:hypothetical protein
MLHQPKVLLLAHQEAEKACLQTNLGEDVSLDRVGSLPELRASLRASLYDVPYQALFCAWPFHKGRWNAAMDEVQKLYPDLPMILLPIDAEAPGALEVLDVGVADIFPKHTTFLLRMGGNLFVYGKAAV